MRCYQFVGLTNEAKKFLEENVEMIPNMVCPDCGKVLTTKQNIINTETMDLFYGDGPTVNQYRLNDGRVISEVVQGVPWSSGPMAFLCLLIDGVEEFKWKYNKSCISEWDSEKGTQSLFI
jgi:hypothetical protein